MKLSEKLLDLVYPENLYCICCGDTTEQTRIHGLCDTCALKISWVTQNPFKNQMEDFAFNDILPCCYYGFHARQIITRIKLSGSPYAARGIGRLMGERLSMEMAEPCSGICSDSRDPAAAAFCPGAIVAVPMHKDKLLVRGYNQAELLARFASIESGIPHWEGALTKIKATSSMRLSDGVTRRQMLQDSFAVSEAYIGRIKGQHLILLDDVITTGSTADAVTRVLLGAGAAKVDVLCFAVSPNKKSGR